MKNNKDLLDDISSLIKVDINALAAYKQAIDNIEDNEILNNLKSFADDHSDHIKNLSKWLNDNGGKAPELKKNMKGLIMEGFTAIAAKIGLKPTFKAMQQNERLTNKKYKDALEIYGNIDLTNLIKKCYEDEVRHLTYFDEQLLK